MGLTPWTSKRHMTPKKPGTARCPRVSSADSFKSLDKGAQLHPEQFQPIDLVLAVKMGLELQIGRWSGSLNRSTRLKVTALL